MVSIYKMDIKRRLQNDIEKLMGRNKAILITGTRRVGKTVLLHSIAEKYQGKSLSLNGEDFDVQELLKTRSAANYKRIVGDATLLMIDEAQVIPEIGNILKLMIDSIPSLTIIATGSSSFDLVNKTGDPLTGRQYQMNLYPIAQLELTAQESYLETRQNLDERLVYGSYPELFQMQTESEKSEYLQQLVQSYLLKDILAYEDIRQSDKIVKLLRLIAYQTGSEVSYNELGNQLGMSKNTVEKYLDLLTKVFILFRLGAYSSNLRKEVSKSSKWYFYDNGIRNAIVNDFRLPAIRTDTGALWENYLISERIKRNAYTGKQAEYFFWRTYDQQEIDLLELQNGKLSAYEFKLAANKKTRIPVFFKEHYPESPFEVITRDNYLKWIA